MAEQRPPALRGTSGLHSVQRRLELVRFDVADEPLKGRPASDPQQPYAVLIADLRHPTAVVLGVEDDVEELLGTADLGSEEEEVGVHLRHPVTKPIIEEVAGHDDDGRSVLAGVRADMANNAYTREVVSGASLVGCVEKDDVNLVPEPPLPKRLVVTEGGEEFYVGTSTQGGGVAVASEGVVVDEGDSSPL